MDDLIIEFTTETLESLSRLDDELIRLEKNPGDEAILGSIFRAAHTIKGTCGFLGLPRLESVAHATENILGKIRDKKLDASAQAVSLVLRSLDSIREMVLHISEHGGEAEGDDSALIADMNRFADSDAPHKAAQTIAAASEGAEADLTVFFKGDDELEALIAAHQAASSPAPGPPQAETAAKPAAKTADKEEGGKESAAGGIQSIRVNIDVLENLMQMVSELVLTRNQLLQVARIKEDRDFLTPLQHLSHLTSELQEGVMKTRMQPISHAWSKFPRLVRDLSLELGKQIELRMNGAETELDRQLLELIRDPLTHMVRNSCDHGLETPRERLEKGKKETGTVTLSAYHEGGHIIIQIADDGKGLNVARIKEKALANGLGTPSEIEAMSEQQIMQFIFYAGFSTAEKITSVSGRGVGMDVVRTNIERMGGTITLASELGKGSQFSIKIPLTLAIVSVLIVEAGGERFAIPQINVMELVRVAPGGEHAIETINGAPVLRLREKLLPLGSLSEMLKLQKEPADWKRKATFVAICKAGGCDFGIIIDRVHDMEEIVVKPVTHLVQPISLYSGNTILGDGSVIMILDPNGLVRRIGNIKFSDQRSADFVTAASAPEENKLGFLLVSTGKGAPKAVPLELVLRLEKIDIRQVEFTGGGPVIQYHDGLLRLFMLDPGMALPTEGVVKVIVFHYDRKTVGLVMESIIDIAHAAFDIKIPSREKGYLGSMIIDGKAVDVMDVGYLVADCIGVDSAGKRPRNMKETHVLLVEDSPFFRNLTQPFLAEMGYHVMTANHGAEALELLKKDASRFQLIITDIEMPVMNGYEFARACKAQSELAAIPLIAYTSKISAEIKQACEKIGIAACIVKTDREGLLDCMARFDGTSREAA